MNIEEIKDSATREITGRRGELAGLSLKLHDNPEVSFRESRAAEWLAGYLEENGFSVERGICQLPTAFRASYGSGKPVVALLAEYDALPGVGHACGHNLIATSSIAAGLAAKGIVDSLGGKIMVIGTPGEERVEGKVLMVERGAFDDVDMAMIVHPGGGNSVVMHTLACQALDVEFFGRAAHAAAHPEEGINALEAMIQSFNAINSLRQHVREKARIHGIITNGGEAVNVVPAHTAASFYVRADDDTYFEELKEKVIKCFAGAATATGAKLEYRWGGALCASMLNNITMARLFQRNMESMGYEIGLGGNAVMNFSTDAGNVSRVVPTIHPLVGIAPGEVSLHTPEFAAIAASEAALDIILGAAGAVAMTIADILSDPGTAARIKEEFATGKEDGTA